MTAPRTAAIGRPPHEIAFVSGIGCSSRIPGYTTAYGFNSVHGRALPIAQGIKMANPDLLVLAAGGDGDGFSIGGGHGCAVAPAGKLACWGHGAQGQLGAGPGEGGTCWIIGGL